ncbi:MAG: MFS transporter [Rhodospirillales bacterium]|nr:MFS transporter [Rhodospirillales bacterium]
MKSSVLIFIIMCAALAMSQFMRAALSVVAPDIMADTGLALDQYGTLAGAFFFGIAAAQIPTGILLDRFGARVTVALMQLLAAAGTIAFVLFDGFWAMFAARFITGMGFASALMGGLVLAARWVPKDRFAQVAGTLIAASQAIGLLLAATPMAALSAVEGWRAAFLLAALVTVLTSMAVWSMVRDAPPDHPWHQRKPDSARDIFQGFLQVLGIKGMGYVMLMAMSGYPIMITLVGVWGGPYLHDVHGLDGLARGNVLSLLVIGGGVGLLAYGPLDRLLDTRKYVVIGGGLLSSGILAILALLEQPPLMVVMGLFALYGLSGAYYITNIALGRALYPEHLIGRGVTTVNLGTFTGVAVVQLITGALMGFFGSDAEVGAGIGSGAGSAPEIAYRCLFGFLSAYSFTIVMVYTRMVDVKPSGERGPQPAPPEKP